MKKSTGQILFVLNVKFFLGADFFEGPLINKHFYSEEIVVTKFVSDKIVSSVPTRKNFFVIVS